MDRNSLNRTECNALRGIAILGIVLHNFTHWLRPMVKENEYTFTQEKADRFIDLLLHPNWDLPAQICSFLGHYGVPVFLFLSAYGLVRKYEKPLQQTDTQPAIKTWSFIKYHFLKLFKMMIAGFVLFIIVDRLTPKPHHYELTDILAQLGMVNNLLTHPEHIIWPGPYWFFGLMLQFYIFYRMVLFRRHWMWIVVLMLVCTAIQMICEPTGEMLTRLRYNFIGGMLPFGAGLLFARYCNLTCRKIFYWVLLIVSLFLIIAMSTYYTLWFLVPIAVCVFCVCAVKLLPLWILRQLEWTGEISAALFIVHPAIRKILIPVAHQGDIYTGLLLYLLAAIAVAWLIRLLLKQIPDPKI